MRGRVGVLDNSFAPIATEDDEVRPSPNYRTGTTDAHRTPPMSETEQPADGKYVIGIWRVVYISLAGTFFVLGMIGIVLPGLPTTPFLLLTSYLLARSWPRMNQMLLANRLTGPILRQWQQHRALEPRTKFQAAFLVCVAMALLICFSSLGPALLTTVLVLASIGLLVIYRLPTITRDSP